MYHPDLDEDKKELLGGLITQSRQRELDAALTEQREPHFHYPALDIQEVRRRISGMLQLDTEIQHNEPNAIVRRLYHDAIEEEANFLRMIESTYEGDNERFRALNQLVEPEPTFEEMQVALSSLRRVLLQGLTRPDTAKISQHLIQLHSGPLQLSFLERPRTKRRAFIHLSIPHAGSPPLRMHYSRGHLGRAMASALAQAGVQVAILGRFSSDMFHRSGCSVA